MQRERVIRPKYEENAARDIWGKVIKPPFPYRIRDVMQGYRDGLVLKEFTFLQCKVCTKSFAIRRTFCQKEVFCPYCKGEAIYIRDRGGYLFRLCAELWGRVRVIYAREHAEEALRNENK